MCVASCCSPLRYSPCSRANVGSLRLRYGSSVLLLVLAVLGGSTLVAAQEAVEMVSATDSIPRANFRTWSLFLVCNPEWLTPEKSQDLFHLYREFSSFGRTIGDDNLAVWFWKSKERSDNPNLAENVDVERSVRYCKALGLKPSEGSSSIMRLGRASKPRPIASICCSPPDSTEAGWCRRAARCGKRS